MISILYFQVNHREASGCNNSCPCGVLSEINSLSCFLPSNNQMLSMSSCPQNQTWDVYGVTSQQFPLCLEFVVRWEVVYRSTTHNILKPFPPVLRERDLLSTTMIAWHDLIYFPWQVSGRSVFSSFQKSVLCFLVYGSVTPHKLILSFMADTFLLSTSALLFDLLCTSCIFCIWPQSNSTFCFTFKTTAQFVTKLVMRDIK